MSETEPLLELDDICVDFPVTKARGEKATLRAVRGVSLQVLPGESIALVGESGCGKSTLGRVMVGLIEPSSGSLHYRGRVLDQRGRQQTRRMLQMVFQNPYGALDPRFRVHRSVREPLDIAGIGSRAERREKVAWALDLVGLGTRHAVAFPKQLSGGQLQRVGIARAIVTSPEVLICDEVTSALDVSVKIQIVELLVELRRKLDISYVFISHDLGIVKQVATRIAVMYLGQIVELMAAGSFYRDAAHPYSRALLDSVPVLALEAQGKRAPVILGGEVPSPIDPPSGCAFRSRCSLAQDICREVNPTLTVRSPSHLVACHFR